MRLRKRTGRVWEPRIYVNTYLGRWIVEFDAVVICVNVTVPRCSKRFYRSTDPLKTAGFYERL